MEKTQDFGTVEVPVDLRRAFLFVPTLGIWIYGVLGVVGLVWGCGYGATTADHLIANGQLDRGSERGLFALSLVGFMTPAFIFLFISRALMGRKAGRMADLAAEELHLPDVVRRLLRKRFTTPWSLSFKGQVLDMYLRSRLGARPNKDRIEDLRSREGWVITVPPDLSTLTVERVPPGYEMKGDYRYSGGSLRRRSQLLGLEEERYKE